MRSHVGRRSLQRAAHPVFLAAPAAAAAAHSWTLFKRDSDDGTMRRMCVYLDTIFFNRVKIIKAPRSCSSGTFGNKTHSDHILVLVCCFSRVIRLSQSVRGPECHTEPECDAKPKGAKSLLRLCPQMEAVSPPAVCES